jgi:hypothetical protein
MDAERTTNAWREKTWCYWKGTSTLVTVKNVARK